MIEHAGAFEDWRRLVAEWAKLARTEEIERVLELLRPELNRREGT